MAQSKDLNTAEEYQSFGEYYYRLAADMECRDEPQEKIEASWNTASINFWQALTLGSIKAPLSLFKCFGQGLGVKKDTDIAALFYGVALQFTHEDCASIPINNRPKVSKSMQPRVDVLVELVKQTHAKIPAEGVTMEKVFNQMTKFNNTIKIPSGKLIQSCFTEQNIPNSSKEQELKSHILQLTKNLASQNKLITTTTNYRSKKSATSRVGCSIS